MFQGFLLIALEPNLSFIIVNLITWLIKVTNPTLSTKFLNKNGWLAISFIFMHKFKSKGSIKEA